MTSDIYRGGGRSTPPVFLSESARERALKRIENIENRRFSTFPTRGIESIETIENRRFSTVPTLPTPDADGYLRFALLATTQHRPFFYSLREHDARQFHMCHMRTSVPEYEQNRMYAP